MVWVFQGNPKLFGIDDYLARYPELVYWRTPRYADRIAVGDVAFIWRSGSDAGAVALGQVVEAPVPASEVEHPEALGDDLWWSKKPDPKEPKTGIRLIEVRILDSEGMVPRSAAKDSPVLAESTLIRMPNGTVFSLPGGQGRALEALWGGSASPGVSPASASEGEKRLEAHYRRERSEWLKREKIKSVVAALGAVQCELCGTKGAPSYPEWVADRIFEVHHRKPLAEAQAPIRTTLEDLAVLCANCHRAVHASKDIESNFEELSERFAREIEKIAAADV